jgi:hypothetical protein
MHQATTLRNMLLLHCCEFSHSLISVAALISSSRHTSLNPSCALMVVVWKQLKWLDISDCNRFWRRRQCLSWQLVCQEVGIQCIRVWLISFRFPFSILITNLGKLPLFIFHLLEVMITLMEMTVKGCSNILSMKTNSGGLVLAVLLNICELYGGLCQFKSRLFCFLQCEWNIGFKLLFHVFFNKNTIRHCTDTHIAS